MQKSPRAQNNNALGRLNVFPHNLTWFLQSHLSEDKSGNDGGHFFIFNEKKWENKKLVFEMQNDYKLQKEGAGNEHNVSSPATIFYLSE